jgi:hypothetical protein
MNEWRFSFSIARAREREIDGEFYMYRILHSRRVLNGLKLKCGEERENYICKGQTHLLYSVARRVLNGLGRARADIHIMHMYKLKCDVLINKMKWDK